MKQRYLEAINIYSPTEDGLKIYRCGRDVIDGRYYRVSVDFISDPYDSETISAQNSYFIIGMIGAFESEMGYSSLEELIAEYEGEGLPSTSIIPND